MYQNAFYGVKMYMESVVNIYIIVKQAKHTTNHAYA